MQFYHQTTSFTTAASSLLNILHHLNPKISLERKQEFLIWRSSVILPTRGSSIYALALYAQKLGFSPSIIVEKKEYDFPDYRFYRYTKEDIELAAFSEQLYQEEAEKAGIPIIFKEIKFAEIKKFLSAGKKLLLRLNGKPLRQSKRNSSHFLAALGFDTTKDETAKDKTQQKYIVIDPAQGILALEESLFQEAFESIESKKHRDHRLIVF